MLFVVINTLGKLISLSKLQEQNLNIDNFNIMEFSYHFKFLIILFCLMLNVLPLFL